MRGTERLQLRPSRHIYFDRRTSYKLICLLSAFMVLLCLKTKRTTRRYVTGYRMAPISIATKAREPSETLEEPLMRASTKPNSIHHLSFENSKSRDEEPSDGRRQRIPTIAIVGRPNVGKSTLYNRVTNQFQSGAIVGEELGTTRDLQYHEVEWEGYRFQVVDTGGLIFKSNFEDTESDEESDIYHKIVFTRTLSAIEEASCVLFVVDGKDGVHPADERIATILRRSNKTVIVCVNKCDSAAAEEALPHEFWRLGLKLPVPLSGIHGTGVSTILHRCAASLKDVNVSFLEDGNIPPISIAIVGRQNAGKSSLLNALCGDDRCIVSPIGGTTRDAIDTLVVREGKSYNFIDTAGLRRNSVLKGARGVEYYSFNRAIKAMRRSEICIFVIDSLMGVLNLEMEIANRIVDFGKACVIVCSKWDAAEKKEKTLEKTREVVSLLLPPLFWSEVLFVSSKTRYGINTIFNAVDSAIKESKRRINTALFNEALMEAMIYRKMEFGRRQPKIYYCTQIAISPPTIVVFCNDHKLFTPQFRKYLDEFIRKSFGFKGSPIRWLWRSKKKLSKFVR